MPQDAPDCSEYRSSGLLFSLEVHIFTSMENNPSWLLPLLRSRVTGALLALLYLHPDQDYTLTEAGKAVGASPKVMSTETDRLVTAGLVREARRGQARLIRAETSGPVSRPLTDLLAVTYGPLPVLSDLTFTGPGRPGISGSPVRFPMTSTSSLSVPRTKMSFTTSRAKPRAALAAR
jgi:hypothetical protein